MSDNIGAQGTVCGGGRYDGLISEFGVQDVAGIGFAVGIERLLMLIENTGVKIPEPKGVKLYIAPMGEEETKKAFEISATLRKNGVSCDMDHMGRGIKAQFKYADKIGARYVVVLGSNELEQGVLNVKDMKDGSQTQVVIGDLCDYMLRI